MGKVKTGGAGRGGFILLDVLVALLIMSFALVVIFGGIALAARSSGLLKKRLISLIAERNQCAENKTVSFVEE
jgi:type II secretory pathway component PulJ